MWRFIEVKSNFRGSFPLVGSLALWLPAVACNSCRELVTDAVSVTTHVLWCNNMLCAVIIRVKKPAR